MLMARVNGLGRLIPTPALNKIMLHRAAGGLEDPYLNRTLYLYNEPSTVTVSHSPEDDIPYATRPASAAQRGGGIIRR